ncbi:hypothetical protein AVEN_166597-1 [Araneus ventricosus]|uniref:Uncharacterized protein n=1 Tax=Araneus ventricosus TaxID=182803 RepID=A0A4Y2KH37_ARAVE|nr:hypothetical protein AVEN_166597-1 [Araneus ventricosus]
MGWWCVRRRWREGRQEVRREQEVGKEEQEQELELGAEFGFSDAGVKEKEEQEVREEQELGSWIWFRWKCWS